MNRSEAGYLGYLASKNKIAGIKQSRKEEYNKNPKLCIYCSSIIKYENRSNKFCNNSCSASYSNKNRKQTKPCLNCGTPIPKSNRKFCCQICQFDYQYKDYVDIFEANQELSLDAKAMRRFLKKYYNFTCISCGLKEWMGQQIPLEVHHIDGTLVNTIDNLQLLCSNCHALTDNFKNKNRNSQRTYRSKYS